MRFGPLPLREAEGAVLAHSLPLPTGKLKKGRVLSAADLARLSEAGHETVIAARLGPGDLAEDAAAERLAAALAPDPAALGLTVSAPFTGRVNLFAARPGLVAVAGPSVDALNGLDEALTLATLPDAARVAPRQMVATVKIIPYAAPLEAVAAAEARLSGAPPVISVAALARRSASLILTRTPGMADKIVEKGAEAVRTRLAALGMALAEETVVAHETGAIAGALARAGGEVVLMLTASATSDRGDVGPAGLIAAGGRLTRFGMPVDPGNLLFVGEIGEAGRSGGGDRLRRPVIGLPGCARSPKLNGADWVLERIAHGRAVGAAEIAAMGVGGLLKEIPSRPAPRAGGWAGEWAGAMPERPRVSALLLAAGAARRMRGRDKLLEDVDGRALIAKVAAELVASGAEEVVAVLPPGDRARRAALAGLGARVIENPRAAEGMGASIAAGIAALSPRADAVLIAMADMPEITARGIDRVIAGFDPSEGRAIVRATAADGRPGHPVLFGRRFFEALGALGGDGGARSVIEDHREFVAEVALPGVAALTDLDTPEAWAAWRAAAADRQGADADR